MVEKGIFYLGAAGTDGKLPLLFYDFKTGARRELARIACLVASVDRVPRRNERALFRLALFGQRPDADRELSVTAIGASQNVNLVISCS